MGLSKYYSIWQDEPKRAVRQKAKRPALKGTGLFFAMFDVQKLLNSLVAEAGESPVFPESPWAGRSFLSA